MATIDVREAEAGPELDAVCAEVLGWRLIKEADGWWGYEKPDGDKTGWSSWQPSTDIAVAWELVKTMLPLRGAPEPEVEPWWIFSGYLEGRLLGPAERVALHIARAFLIAHGVTEIEVGDDTP